MFFAYVYNSYLYVCKSVLTVSGTIFINMILQSTILKSCDDYIINIWFISIIYVNNHMLIIVIRFEIFLYLIYNNLIITFVFIFTQFKINLLTNVKTYRHTFVLKIN